MAKSAYYPSLRIGATYAATNNPAAAFTMILNQRQLSLMSDFNHPDTTDNINTRLMLNWSLYDARGRSRHGHRQECVAAAGQSRSSVRIDDFRGDEACADEGNDEAGESGG